MQRINTSDGLFQLKNALTGETRTVITTDWLNTVQEEIANVIIRQGIPLDPDQDDQLYQAITTIAVSGVGTVINRYTDIEVKNVNIFGDLLPNITATRNLGSPAYRFSKAYIDEIYLSGNTLYLGDTPIIGTDANIINIKADRDQSIVVKTIGAGESKVISENGVELSTSGLNSSVNVQSTGVGGKVQVGATQQVDITAPTVNINGVLTVDSINIENGLTIEGAAVNVNATNLLIEDNIVTINNGEAGTGVAEGQAGIKVDRGDSPDYMIIFDETDDKFKVGELGNLKTVATLDDITTGDKSFIWNQSVPTNTWVISHTLSKYPSVTVVDSANSCVIGDIEYTTLDVVVVRFSASFSGKAYLN